MGSSPRSGTRLRRALSRRCPRCGSGVFDGYFQLAEHCPGCGLRFEREPGYWVGAVIINTTITFAIFVALFVGLTLITWPDVPWGWVMGVTVGVNLVVPVIFYPLSKTIWLALDLGWHPLDAAELEGANRRATGA